MSDVGMARNIYNVGKEAIRLKDKRIAELEAENKRHWRAAMNRVRCAKCRWQKRVDRRGGL